MAEPNTPPAKKFECVTTAQVERTYVVTATDEDQARARLRTHMKDADLLREGIVEEKAEEQENTTPERIKDIKVLPHAAAKPAAEQKAS